MNGINIQAAGQRYSFSIKEMSFGNAIKIIEEKTGYSFLYAKQDVSIDVKVSLEVKSEDIDVVLNRFLHPLHLAYVIKEKVVVVSAMRTSTVEATSFTSAVDVIRGMVLDEKGRPFFPLLVFPFCFCWCSLR